MFLKVLWAKNQQQTVLTDISNYYKAQEAVLPTAFFISFQKEVLPSKTLCGYLKNMRRALPLLICCISISCFAQVRIEKLVVKAKDIYTLAPSDIIVADTLVMMDSSRIRLNDLKGENYIRTHVAIIGKNCVIDGRGINGKRGQNGAPGRTPIGPCVDGGPGRNGGRGLDGASGLNLFLYIDSINVKGSLIIDLSGGDGADGGNGGGGGGGSPGTTHCYGGNGGDGGNGGAGGSGGRGGTLSLGGNGVSQFRTMIGQILTIQNKGGSFGYGGISGYGGPSGLGPDKKNGKMGAPGSDGIHGRPADNGTILFENQ
jgi:hypothetical protein